MVSSLKHRVGAFIVASAAIAASAALAAPSDASGQETEKAAEAAPANSNEKTPAETTKPKKPEPNRQIPLPKDRGLKINPKLAPPVAPAGAIKTPSIQFTGVGSPLSGTPVATVTTRTPAIAFTGLGAPLITRVEVTPTAIAAPAITFTGTGSMEPR